MGGGGNKGARSPHIAKISLESAQRLKLVDVICEGVKDLTHPMSGKDIYLNGTPLQNADGSYNFEGVEIHVLPGTADQEYLPGFETSDTVINVGAEVKYSNPIVRQVIDPNVDRIRVTIGFQALESIRDNGDTEETAVDMEVRAVNQEKNITKSQSVRIVGRTNSTYHRDVILEDLPPTPFTLSVVRHTPDAKESNLRNKSFWTSYVESIDAKLNYPHSVVVGLKIDSAQFGGNVPRRTYRSHWTVVEIPENYNPQTREYSGIWNGRFKRAWTDNPAWIYRDLVVNDRYGLGRYRKDIQVDKWALYAIAQYCDELVDDGNGKQEPRFTCNCYITSPRDAYDVLSDLASCFRGIAFYDGLQFVATQDRARDPVAHYGNNNVIDGLFEYSGTSYKDIITACIVKFSDKDNSYLSDSVQYQDDASIERFGYNVKTLTAFGCTSRGQAQRVARWVVETAIRERESVSFSVGREGIKHLPYDIIRVADNDYAGAQIAARIVKASGNQITLDRAIDKSAKTLRYLDAQGREQTRKISAVKQAVITVDAPANIPKNTPVIITGEVEARLFRAIGIKENDDGSYTISAVSHDAQKEAVTDKGATRVQAPVITRHSKPQVYAPQINTSGDKLLLKWDVIGNTDLRYEIKIYRNSELYQTHYTDTPLLALYDLPLGDYRAEIRAIDTFGGISDPIERVWQLSYDITNLRAIPKVFAIELNWSVPENIINDAWIEIWSHTSNDISAASRLARLPYPASQYTMSNLRIEESYYFWARMVDKKGNIGNWSGEIKGQPSQDPAPILEQINGQITQSVLHQDLVDQLNNIEAVVTPPMAGDAINYAGDNTVFAGVWSLSSAIQAGDLAQAEKTDLVLSQVNDAKAAIQQTSKTVVDLKKGTSALYTLAAIATDGEGKPVIGGITVGVDGKTASSEILLQADKLMLWSGDKKPMFAIVNGKTAINGDLIADGTILGQHIKANQTLSAPNISGGQLDIGGGRGRFRVENDGHVSITSSGRSGLTITNESIEVRDDNGVLRVKIGKL